MTQAFNTDCMTAMAQMKDNEFDLAIVDIPYGLGDKLTQGGTWANKYKKGDAEWDVIPDLKYFEELFRVSINQIIWGGNYVSLPSNRCYIIWDKVALMPTMADSEYAWTSFDSNAKTFRHVRNTSEKRIHMTQKPIALYKWLLKNYAKEGDTILDTHLGSSSSRIAAHDMGFDFTGYEIDADYFKASELRFNNHIQQQSLFKPKEMY